MELRLRQPRDYESVLRADAVRHRRRAGAPRDYVTVDWFGGFGRFADDRRDEHAISGNADGIAVCVVDPVAFNKPIQKALDNGIPVIAYNANGKGPGTNPALAYVGQDLFQS